MGEQGVKFGPRAEHERYINDLLSPLCLALTDISSPQFTVRGRVGRASWLLPDPLRSVPALCFNA